MDSARYNTLSSAELKRRGVAAIEQALQHGPCPLYPLDAAHTLARD